MAGPAVLTQFNQIEYDDRGWDDYGLANFQSIDSSIYINGISAKNCQHPHVHIIEETCFV